MLYDTRSLSLLCLTRKARRLVTDTFDVDQVRFRFQRLRFFQRLSVVEMTDHGDGIQPYHSVRVRGRTEVDSGHCAGDTEESERILR